MAPAGRSRRWSRGFTLIEMLVVIAVVCVLLAMLMPAVNGARQKATAAICASNMRQIYQATILFTQDNNGQLPLPTWVQENASNTTSNYQRAACWLNIDNGPGGGLISFETGGLWKYLGTAGDVAARKTVMNCPGDRDERTLRMGQRNLRNFSYSYNSNIRKPRADDGINLGVAIRLAAVLHAPDRIMVYEEIGPNDAWCVSPQTSMDDVPAGRHGSLSASNQKRTTGTSAPNQLPAFYNQGLGNQCFFDGHVELVSPRWIVEGKGTNAGFRSWGPSLISEQSGQ